MAQSATPDPLRVEALPEDELDRIGFYMSPAPHAVGHRPAHARVVRRLLSHQALTQPHLSRVRVGVRARVRGRVS